MLAALIPYAVAFLLFAAIDIVWISSVAAKMFKETLGDVLASEFRLAPAVAFYLMYPAGIVYFAVLPALKTGSAGQALLNGALFGLFTYATYDLTNYATIRNWTLGITALDIVYGAVIGALVAAATVLVTPAVMRWFGA